MMKVAVIGSGSWGSAIAWLLGEKGIPVWLWARDARLAEQIDTEHHNARYLSDIHFSETVHASADLATVTESADAIVLATPSSAVVEIAQHLRAAMRAQTTTAAGAKALAKVPLILLSKGLDAENNALLLTLLAETLGAPERLAVLSGPNHAEEVARGVPTATVVASAGVNCAQFFQDLLGSKAFRIYTTDDTIGVQLCGATKNVIAIACGLAAGIGFGDNTAATIMTRGLAEISRLVQASGGKAMTCMGLAGMGDLIATCTSEHSRNRSFGVELASGGTLQAYQQRTHMVVEGALACRTVSALAQKLQVEMPICEQVRAVVWDGQDINAAAEALSFRDPKPEFY